MTKLCYQLTDSFHPLHTVVPFSHLTWSFGMLFVFLINGTRLVQVTSGFTDYCIGRQSTSARISLLHMSLRYCIVLSSFILLGYLLILDVLCCCFSSFSRSSHQKSSIQIDALEEEMARQCFVCHNQPQANQTFDFETWSIVFLKFSHLWHTGRLPQRWILLVLPSIIAF